VPAYQAQGPKFRLHYCKKKKEEFLTTLFFEKKKKRILPTLFENKNFEK
jgi:hypothetical protein